MRVQKPPHQLSTCVEITLSPSGRGVQSDLRPGREKVVGDRMRVRTRGRTRGRTRVEAPSPDPGGAPGSPSPRWGEGFRRGRMGRIAQTFALKGSFGATNLRPGREKVVGDRMRVDRSQSRPSRSSSTASSERH